MAHFDIDLWNKVDFRKVEHHLITVLCKKAWAQVTQGLFIVLPYIILNDAHKVYEQTQFLGISIT